MIEDGIIERQLFSASYERDVYEVTLVRTDDAVEMEIYQKKVDKGFNITDVNN